MRRSLLALLGMLVYATNMGCAPTAPAGLSAPAATAAPAAAVRDATTRAPAAAAPGQLKKVQFGHVPTLASSPILIANRKGYLAEAGLDVDLNPLGNGNEGIAPMGVGQLDAAIIAPTVALVNAAQSGLAIRIVASTGISVPGRWGTGFGLRKDLADSGMINSFADLPRPIRVAAASEGIVQHAMVVLAAQHDHVPLSDIDMVFIPLPEMNVALKNSAVDVASHAEPLLTIGEQQGILKRWRQFSEILYGVPYGVIIYGDNLRTRDPATGQGLMEAWLRGVRDFEAAFTQGQDRAAVVDMLSDGLKLPPAMFDELERNGGFPWANPDGAVEASPLQTLIGVWQDQNLVRPATAESLLDRSFADRAVGKLGKYQGR